MKEEEGKKRKEKKKKKLHTHIMLWTIIHGTNPNDGSAEIFDILQTLRDALKISYSIIVGVLETCGIDLVHHARFPPAVRGGGGGVGHVVGRCREKGGKRGMRKRSLGRIEED